MRKFIKYQPLLGKINFTEKKNTGKINCTENSIGKINCNVNSTEKINCTGDNTSIEGYWPINICYGNCTPRIYQRVLC